jgi:hypothetical protein
MHCFGLLTSWVGTIRRISTVPLSTLLHPEKISTRKRKRKRTD